MQTALVALGIIVLVLVLSAIHQKRNKNTLEAFYGDISSSQEAASKILMEPQVPNAVPKFRP